eukprot:1579683-Prymnesium_polylepis.1
MRTRGHAFAHAWVTVEYLSLEMPPIDGPCIAHVWPTPVLAACIAAPAGSRELMSRRACVLGEHVKSTVTNTVERPRAALHCVQSAQPRCTEIGIITILCMGPTALKGTDLMVRDTGCTSRRRIFAPIASAP